jgi:hypothetical protein
MSIPNLSEACADSAHAECPPFSHEQERFTNIYA